MSLMAATGFKQVWTGATKRDVYLWNSPEELFGSFHRWTGLLETGDRIMIGHPGKAPLLTNKDGARLKLTAVWRTQEQYSRLTKASHLPNKRDTSAVFISFIQFLLQNLDYLHLKCLSWIHIFNFSQFHLNKKQKPSQRAASCSHCVDTAAQRSLFTACTTHSDEHFFCYQGSSVRRHSGTTAQLITFPVSMGTRSSHRCDVIHPRRPGHFSVVFRFKHTSVKYKNNT